MAHSASLHTHRATASAGSLSAAAGGGDQSPSPGAAPHAYVVDGDLYVMDGGRYWLCDYSQAWSIWLEAAVSPIASTQERARQIRAAMDEAYPQAKAA